MAKKVIVTEKPSVAMEFAKALKINTNRKDGYIESDEWIITWCYGHLVTMSYPEAYDEKLKMWRFDTLPFLPKEWKYEVLPGIQEKQFNIIKSILQRDDVEIVINSLKKINCRMVRNTNYYSGQMEFVPYQEECNVYHSYIYHNTEISHDIIKFIGNPLSSSLLGKHFTLSNESIL